MFRISILNNKKTKKMPLNAIAQAALAQAGGSAGSGLVNGIFGWIGQRKQRKHENYMFDKQVATNRENWSLENQYNSPEMQMARLKQAGLNPNLVYNNGANAQGGTIENSNPTVTDQSKAFEGFGRMADQMNIAALYDLKLKQAQTDQLNASAQNLGVQSELTNATKYLRELESQAQRTSNAWQKQKIEADIELIRSNITKNYADTLNTNANTRVQNVTENSIRNGIDMAIQKNSRENLDSAAGRSKMAAEIAKMVVEKQKMQSETGLNQAKTHTEIFEVLKKQLENTLLNMDINYVKDLGIGSKYIETIMKVIAPFIRK